MVKLFAPIFLIIVFASCGVKKVDSQSEPVTHAQWTKLLQKHVDNNGLVDYKGFVTDSLELNEYLHLLSTHHPNDSNWDSNQRKAYWINAYNAFTVQL
ncbi:MAG: DUF547 domain-containing protein, partial [Flavobacteriales bacterium]|nr:DUF547 domain-containing protein [Flavobacteriales bacterium]